MGVTRPKWRQHRSVHQAIDVSFPQCGITGVKFSRNNFHLEHAHVLTDVSINCRTQLLRRYVALKRDTRDLTFGMNARVSTARAVDIHASPFNQRAGLFDLPLDRPQFFLALPSVKVRAVILKKQFVIHGLARRLPGLTAASPSLHASQFSGSTDNTFNVANATRGTPTSALPPERSMIDAAATTSAPARCTASIVSRVEPPVVITSSTTSVFSPPETVNPRRNVISPASLSVHTNRAPNARATS